MPDPEPEILYAGWKIKARRLAPYTSERQVRDVGALLAFEAQRREDGVDVRGQRAQPVGADADADPQDPGASRRREGPESRQCCIEGSVSRADLSKSGTEVV